MSRIYPIYTFYKTAGIVLSLSMLLSSTSAFAAKVGTVSGDSVSLFGNPDKDSSSLTTLHNGDVVTISNYPTKGYYKARTSDGQVGWVDSSSLLVGENAAPNSDIDNAAGAAQIVTPPANQDPQSADNLVPAPPSTPDPVTPGAPKEEIPEVPPPPAPEAAAAQNPPPLPAVIQAPIAAPAPTALTMSPTDAGTLPPAPLGELQPGMPVAPSAPANTGAVGGAPVQNGSPSFTYEDVEPGLNYEVENHRNGPRPVETYSHTSRQLYTISLFVGGDLVNMSDINALLGSSAFTSVTYFGGEFGYALTDEVKLIGRVEYLTSSNNGGTANLNLSSNPVYAGVGFQIGRWKYVHFYASGLVGIGFNTQITATAPNSPAPNQTTLSESTFSEMVKFDASIPIHKAFGAFLEGGYRFMKTSSLSPNQIGAGSTIFQSNGSYPPTAIDMSGPFFGAGASFQF